MPKIFSIEIPADLETPVSAYLKLRPSGACFLLESTENIESIGRFSFIGLNPVLTVGLKKGATSLSFLRKDILRQSDGDMPSLLGGLVGYVGYEICNLFDNVPRPKTDPIGLPPVYLIRPGTIIVFDHLKKKMGIFTIARGKIDEIINTFTKPIPALGPEGRQIDWVLRRPARHMAGGAEKNAKGLQESNFSARGYESMVRRAKDYITAGDIFQVVLSHRLSGQTSVEPFQTYRAMRILNPSPYMFFFEFGDTSLVGSSPEMLVKAENNQVLLRPIAGTRPRGSTPSEDIKLKQELLSNPKENAEHSMLVDLGRNDLGRVCEFGSVHLSEHKKVEFCSHVMHMVSTITGRLKDDKDIFDLFQAVFPAGTVTGAPKIRAMEIITELENTCRGPYAGAMGYFGANGNMDMCLTIRTIVFKGNRYFIQAGAGIVYDSNPSQEYQETLNKMAVLRKAIEMAEREQL
jgi:anthranilate synthase component 1